MLLQTTINRYMWNVSCVLCDRQTAERSSLYWERENENKNEKMRETKTTNKIRFMLKQVSKAWNCRSIWNTCKQHIDFDHSQHDKRPSIHCIIQYQFDEISFEFDLNRIWNDLLSLILLQTFNPFYLIRQQLMEKAGSFLLDWQNAQSISIT